MELAQKIMRNPDRGPTCTKHQNKQTVLFMIGNSCHKKLVQTPYTPPHEQKCETLVEFGSRDGSGRPAQRRSPSFSILWILVAGRGFPTRRESQIQLMFHTFAWSGNSVPPQTVQFRRMYHTFVDLECSANRPTSPKCETFIDF